MTLQPAGTKDALTLEDLAPYPCLSYEQGEHKKPLRASEETRRGFAMQ